MSTLRLTDIAYAYDAEQVLENFSLEVEQGSFVSLIGPSGSGKSTILRIIAGLETPKSGAVHINDAQVNNLPAAERGVGMVFQHPSLFPHLSVQENITFGIRDLDKAEQQQRMDQWLVALGMEGLESRYPHQLSGGQQQRVALARALVMQPKLLLLDEPFANLDALLRKAMREEVLHVLKDQKITTLLVTHDPAEAMAVSDHVAVIDAGGTLLHFETPERLRTLPKDEFVSTLLAAA